MGLQDRPYYHDDRSGSSFAPQGRSVITNLIIINAIVFVIDAFILHGTQYSLVDVFAARTTTLSEPWTWWRFLTYGFIHAPNNVYHIIGNMVGLFFLGQDVERLYGGKRFLRLYLTSLVLCSIIWAVLANVMGRPGLLIGASGAVTSVIILFCLNFPRRTILLMMFIPMPAWVLGVLIILMNAMSFDPSGASGGGHAVAFDVHLVGALYGYVYFKTQWAFGSWFGGGGGGGGGGGWKFRLPRSKPKLKVHRPEASGIERQADVVLEKLHREGQESLSPRERKILEDYSRRMKQKHR